MSASANDGDLSHAGAGIGADLDSLLVFNVSRTHGYLRPFLNANLRRRSLTAAQFNTLLVLQAAGSAGLAMGEIGRLLVVTKSNVTGLIDRLEHQGLAVRGNHRDRRATIVRLTTAGKELLNRTIPRHSRFLTELTGCLTVAEKRKLIHLLTKLRRGLRLRRGSKE